MNWSPKLNQALLLSLALVGLPAMTPPPLDRAGGFFTYFGGDLSQLEEMARRYDVVIWHHHPEIRHALPELKSCNPRLKAFMYRNLFCILQRETPLEESVGNFDEISAHHPDWFQHDHHGRRVEVPDYPGRWMMDLGNPEWQDFWIQETLKDVLEGNWDGVFADDALTEVTSHQLPPLAGYPDNAALQEAVYGFLVKAHEAFRKANKLFVANVSSTYDYPGLWEKWLKATDGLMEEHFAGEGWTWGQEVANRQLEAMQLAAREGKWMFCMTYGPWEDRQRMLTSLAAHLIGAGPKTYWSYRPYEYSDDPAWDPFWEHRLGQPLEQAKSWGPLWQRRFEHGVAAANTGSSSLPWVWSGVKRSLKPHQGVVIEDGAAAGRLNSDGAG